jgi:ubiquinone/menaquinone biosynthesis C-methylase UbiE
MTVAKVQPVGAIAAAYDQWAGVYESDENATRDLASAVLRKQLTQWRDLDVLEIGCGTGLNTRWLAGHCRTVLALDFSTGMLRQAFTSMPVTATNVLLGQQDIRQQWGIANNSVDLMVCTLVLEHIADLDHIFNQAARVLRPGGQFFICELHPFRQLVGRQARFTEAETGETVLVPAYLHDVADYLNAMIRHGFALIHVGEWRDEDGGDPGKLPRLLSIHGRATHI